MVLVAVAHAEDRDDSRNSEVLDERPRAMLEIEWDFGGACDYEGCTGDKRKCKLKIVLSTHLFEVCLFE